MARIAEIGTDFSSGFEQNWSTWQSAKIRFWTNFWSLYLAIIYAWPKSLLELDDCF